MEKPRPEDIRGAKPYRILENDEGNRQQVRMMKMDLPKNQDQLDHCISCMEEGRFNELQDDFMMAGYDFQDGEKDLIVQVSCRGKRTSMLGKWLCKRDCLLTMTQYDEEGNKLSEMEVEE